MTEESTTFVLTDAAEKWLKDHLQRRRNDAEFTLTDMEMPDEVRVRSFHNIAAVDAALAHSLRPSYEIDWRLVGNGQRWEARVGKEKGRNIILQVVGTERFSFVVDELVTVTRSPDYPRGLRRVRIVDSSRIFRLVALSKQQVSGRFIKLSNALLAASCFWDHYGSGRLPVTSAALVAVSMYVESLTAAGPDLSAPVLTEEKEPPDDASPK